MSPATIEFPSTTTQLYFSFGEETVETPRKLAKKKSASGANRRTQQAVLSNEFQVPSPSTPAQTRPAVQAVSKDLGCQSASIRQESVSSAVGNGQEPIRIGTLLMRLLKQYGITDEEIAEGIKAYAAKRAASKPQMVSISA